MGAPTAEEQVRLLALKKQREIEEARELIQEAAKGFTEAFDGLERQERLGFSIFLFDYEHGQLQYISDMKHEDVIEIIKNWMNRERQ
jgi:hypothetical protein